MLEGLEGHVREAVTILTALRDNLSSQIEGAPEESPLHSTVGCVVVDALDPAIRDLTQALDQPHGVPKVRRATREDLAHLYPLLTKEPEFTRTPGILPREEDIERSLEHPHVVILVATLGDDIAGCIHAVLETSIAGTIRLLYTRPEFRGRGVGRSLVSHCAAILMQERDVKEIGAYAGEGTALASFLSAQGFHRGSVYFWFSKELAADTLGEIGPV